MNAAGISVFYGATDASVALAEVRPPVGSRVIVARFEIVRPLRLLDFGALEFIVDHNGSDFDKAHIQRLKRAAFLRRLCRRVSRPVMPHDEPRDYLPTQAVADYLANLADPSLDGIIYPSVQFGDPSPGILSRASRGSAFGSGRSGRNVVLFHTTASVVPLCGEDETDISVSNDSLFGVPEDLDADSYFSDTGPEATYLGLGEVDWRSHAPAAICGRSEVLKPSSPLRQGCENRLGPQFGASLSRLEERRDLTLEEQGFRGAKLCSSRGAASCV